jgi:tRNA nucleotidyltransferase (CCA-adding enzyme)
VAPDAHRLQVLDACAAAAAPLPVRFACLVFGSHAPGALADRWRAPGDCKALAEERCDALRRPARFDELLLAAECEAPGIVHAARLRAALQAASGIDTARIAAQAAQAGARGPAIGAAVQAARIDAVAAL